MQCPFVFNIKQEEENGFGDMSLQQGKFDLKFKMYVSLTIELFFNFVRSALKLFGLLIYFFLFFLPS